MNHPNNIDPAFIPVFGIQNMPLPLYSKDMLKQLITTQLQVIQTQWNLSQDATAATRRGLINAMLAHPLERIDVDVPDYDTDTEPEQRSIWFC